MVSEDVGTTMVCLMKMFRVIENEMTVGAGHKDITVDVVALETSPVDAQSKNCCDQD